MSESTIRFGTASARVIIHDPLEHIQKHWACGVFYETGRNGLLTYMASRYPRGLTYVDVGASIGNHTLFFLSVLEAFKVISVEPYPESDAQLYQNVALNGWDHRVDAYAIAASDKKERLKMVRYDTPDHVNIGMIKSGTVRIDERDVIEVGAAPLDYLVGGDHVDVIKIDVEHMNIPVLEGARETLANGPDVFIECENAQELSETDAFMREVGYARINRVFNSTPTYCFLKT